MPVKQVDPIVDLTVRKLCMRPYPNHPGGCPNFGKRPCCPPSAPVIDEVLDLCKPVWVIWNVFDFAGHVSKMLTKHPHWSDRQLACCLYWQGSARKSLRELIRLFLDTEGRGLHVLSIPEANGVNVTATMKSIGIELEWPPHTVTYQVVLAGSLGG